MLRRNWLMNLAAAATLVALGVIVGCGKKSAEFVTSPDVKDVGAMKPGEVMEVPYILWGGDVATYYANGGAETKPGSIYARQGLNVKLTRNDDPGKQVKEYLEGKTPFLRMTMSMLGQVSEDICKDSRTRPVIFLQLTWSAGDHMVGRPSLRNLNDLKGKKIALQSGGPHVGMLNDILRTAKLEWSDITVVWTEDVTGPKGPAALFGKDATVDACFAITPDMESLTGGLDSTGTGEKETVKGAKVVVSTAQMSRSIADVYACRKDFFDKNKALVEKFAAGYLKASEDLVDLRKKWDNDKNKATDAKYDAVLKMTQDMFGKEDIKKLDDAHGLIMDASFVGLPGNISFFTDRSNLSGFLPKARAAIALPADPAKDPLKNVPDVESRFLTASFDYDRIRTLGGMAGVKPPEGGRFEKAEIKDDPEKIIYEFLVKFEPNESKFSEEKYGTDFQRALEMASLFGNTVIAVRGHADPGLLVQRFVRAALDKGIIVRKGDKFALKDGGDLDLNNTKQVLDLIQKNDLSVNETFQGRTEKLDLKDSVRMLQKLSDDRANTVRSAVVGYGGRHSLKLDASQIRSIGVGVTSPVVGYPETDEDAAKNRRVEFRIIKVPSDAIRTDDFNF